MTQLRAPTVSFVFCFEQTEPDRVITHAQSQPGHRPNENATCGARLERADTHGQKTDERATAEAKNDTKD
jgi:hypothetical protein